ncbi:MAG TPA: hypothetical protein VLA34_01095, partial [Candidatus Krumholzibacterium sp.]|nr:hypothetical protein [Candidatus Krumholzibacterium sp.]
QTRDQRAAEALEAAEWLGTVKEVDAGSVGVFGGSEGGDIALLAGMREPCPAFVVPASASVGGSIFEVMRHRAESAGARLGLGAGEILKAVTFKELMYVFMSGADIVEWPLIEARVSAWGDDTWKEFAAIARGRIDEAEGGAEDGQGREAAFETLKEVLARFGGESWFAATDAAGTLQRMTVMDARTFFLLLGSNRFSSDWDRTVCPAEVAGICCPLFALWGEYDSFLPPRISASRLRSYLGGSGRSGDRIEVLAGGSHYLTTGGPSAPFVDGAFDSIASWIKGVTSP